MTPKPAYDVLKDLIKERWWTRCSVLTGQNGRAGFRGYLGDDQVTVHINGRVAAQQTLHLGRAAKNRFVVKLTTAAKSP